MPKTTIDIARKPITFRKCDERHEIFSPSWDLVQRFLQKWITWEQYVKEYYDEMRQAFKANRQAFVDMAKRLNDVEFICWCNKTKPKTEQCHRFLLKNILLEVAKREL